MKEKPEMKFTPLAIKKYCIVPLIFFLPTLGGIACSTQAALNTTADALHAAGNGINTVSDNLREAAPFIEEDLENAWYNLTGNMSEIYETTDFAQNSPALAEAQEARDKLISGTSIAELVANASNLITTDDVERINNGDFGSLNGILPFEINVESVGEDLAAVLNSLDIGQVSAILQSEVGYHLVQLLDENGGQIRIGHLVFQVDPVEETVDEPVEEATATEELNPLQQAINRLAEVAYENGHR